MSAFSGPEITNSGLILHLDPANSRSYPGSGTAVSDLSGQSSSNILTNGPVLSNKEFVFDGADDYIAIASPSRKYAWAPAGTTGNKIISIETWVKTSDTDGNIVSKPWNSSGNYNYRITHNSFLLQVSALRSLSFPSIADGNWKHIVAIANETQYGVYVNGSLVAGFTNHLETSDTPSSGEATFQLCLMTLFPYGEGGATWPRPTFCITGSMSLFRFYNRQLTSSEVLNNYEAMRGRFSV